MGNQLRWSRASSLVLFFHRTTDLNCARPDIHSSSPSFVLPIQIGRHRCYLFIYFLFLFLFFTKKFQLNWPHFNLLIVVHSFCDRDLILAQIHWIYSNNLTNNLFWDDFISMSICYISVLWFGSFLLFVVVFRTTIKTKQNRKTVIKRNWPGFGGRISSQIHTGHSLTLIYWHLRGTVWHDYYEFPCKTLKHYNFISSDQSETTINSLSQQYRWKERKSK